MTLRVAVYSRHSTDKQNPTSSADQAEACRRVVDYLGGEVVGTYLDPALSGYRSDRPGLRRLLQDVRDGLVDLVVCEVLDRIVRDAEDVAWLGEKLQFSKVRLHTVSENGIDDIRLAVASMLGAIFTSQLQQKTVRGVLEIVPEEPEVVRQTHRDFETGRSARDIAKRLNAEGVPFPRGGQWNQSTIRGDPKKHVGILDNPPHRGELVRDRREWRKEPEPERRYRLRDESEWTRFAMPDLRIVDDDLA